MARMVRNAKMETREGRSKFAVSDTPYWQPIHRCGHIGYYKGKNTRAWYARFRNEGKNAGYTKKKIALADDIRDADGKIVLSFREAQLAAQEWFKSLEMQRAGYTPSGIYTVKDAIDDYAQWYKLNRKSWKTVSYQIDAHIIPTLGKIDISKLTAKKIQEWHAAIAQSPPRLRTSKFSDEKNMGALNSDEARRKRKATANRILNTLKAALNKAYQDGKVANDDAWRRIKPFKAVESAKMQYLTTDEAKRLVNACLPEFRPMIQAALFTGCRYGELCNVKVSDFNTDSGTLSIQESKSGKPRHVILTEEGQAFFTQATFGKNGTDLIFTRFDGSQWGRSHQTRRLKEASEIANIDPAASFHILRHTHASQLAMAGVPMAVIAQQLGHSDTRICEKHYAHLSPSYVADTIRANFPKLDILKESNVRRIGK